MLIPLAPLLMTALLAPSAPPPPKQTSTLRSPNDNTVTEVNGKTFKQWTEDLKNPDASVREEAIRCLILFGHESLRAVPMIVERLQDTDSSPRVKAAIALGMLDVHKDDIPKVVTALGQRLLEDQQSVVRYYAAASLVNFGEDAKYAQAGLIKGVTDAATWEIRFACVSALRTAGRDSRGGPAPAVAHALIRALQDRTYRVRLEAILALGSLGKPDDRMLFLLVVQALQERLSDRDAAVKIWANVALMVLDEVNDKSVHAVIKFLKHADPKVRIEAARGLGVVGSRNKSKVPMVEPALTEALQDKEVTVIGAAAKALAEMDELNGPVRANLLDLLKNPDAGVRAAGAQSFGLVGIKGRSAVSSLTELILDKDQPPHVVSVACWALGEIGEPAPAAIAALTAIGQRKDADEVLKQYAQTALDHINKLK
jgi:HEAT repeat protein